MKNILILMTCFVILAGCAPRLYVNGAPASDHLLILENPETGIQAFSQIIKSDVIREGNEAFEELSYLSPGEIVLGSDTRGLYVTLRVVNDAKHAFTIWEVYDVTYTGEKYPYHVEHMLYSGRLSIKEISVPCPIKNVKSGAFRLEIRDREGDPMIVVGSITYRPGRGGQELPN
jgi:hypothetical protein